MSNTATRLINLILMLQRRPGQKAADLANQLGISIRSIHRYFEMLDELGVPVYAERGPYGGFSLARGYKLPPLVFTPEEAVAISLGTSLVGEMWSQLYHEAAQGALVKLENVLPDEQRQEIAWAQRSLVATRINRNIENLAPMLEKLRRAARENRRVNMLYHSGSNPHGSQRELDPYALAHHQGWWYVVGFCHLRQELRTFRVDRIAELSLTAHTFPPPEGFDIRAYMAREIQGEPQITVRMRFVPQFSHLALYGSGYWASLENQPDGSIEVTFNAPEINSAASTALAYGPSVTVLEPPEVRKLVRDWASATAELY